MKICCSQEHYDKVVQVCQLIQLPDIAELPGTSPAMGKERTRL